MAVKKLTAPRKPSHGYSLFDLALSRLRRDMLTLLAAGFLLISSLLATFGAPLAEQLLDTRYDQIDTTQRFLPMGSPGHPLGTDDLGRDQLVRLLYAGRVSLGIAVSSALIALLIGIFVGVITGYFRGWVDDLINWVMTTINSIPTLFLLLIVAAVLGGGPLMLILLLSTLGWTGTARLVRAETLTLRERDYVLGAEAAGASSWRMMFVHIVPNLLSSVIINLTVGIGGLILTESALSFLGVGVKEPTPTWGNMLTNAQTFFNRGAHLVFAPGLMIMFTVLCLFIIGDGLRDAFDPKSRSR